MTVERNGAVIGSAKPTVKSGDPAFEVRLTCRLPARGPLCCL
jgi:hypothetical protein